MSAEGGTSAAAEQSPQPPLLHHHELQQQLYNLQLQKQFSHLAGQQYSATANDGPAQYSAASVDEYGCPVEPRSEGVKAEDESDSKEFQKALLGQRREQHAGAEKLLTEQPPQQQPLNLVTTSLQHTSTSHTPTVSAPFFFFATVCVFAVFLSERAGLRFCCMSVCVAHSLLVLYPVSVGNLIARFSRTRRCCHHVSLDTRNIVLKRFSLSHPRLTASRAPSSNSSSNHASCTCPSSSSSRLTLQQRRNNRQTSQHPPSLITPLQLVLSLCRFVLCLGGHSRGADQLQCLSVINFTEELLSFSVRLCGELDAFVLCRTYSLLRLAVGAPCLMSLSVTVIFDSYWLKIQMQQQQQQQAQQQQSNSDSLHQQQQQQTAAAILHEMQHATTTEQHPQQQQHYYMSAVAQQQQQPALVSQHSVSRVSFRSIVSTVCVQKFRVIFIILYNVCKRWTLV